MALSVKFFGAIALGVIYEFYYGGGDTFNYFTHGSRWIWEAFLENPANAFKLIASSGENHMTETYYYSSRIWYYSDVRSYFVVRLAGFFDIFTFHTYSATALFFAIFSFSGSWALFTSLLKRYPNQRKWLALAILFVPSVLFWGSGILKDSVTLGALGWATFGLFNAFYFRKRVGLNLVILVLSLYLIYQIKIYILIPFIFAAFVWLFSLNIKKVKNQIARILVAPVFIALFVLSGYYAVGTISKDSLYSIDNIAKTAAITSYDIRYGWGARMGEGSGFTIGKLDGTWQSMVSLFPAAVNASLFRPYLWEVGNPLMLMSALESLLAFFLMFKALMSKRFMSKFSDPFLIFCLAYTLLFAFAVGVSTSNFGTLMRYKIPMMPFFFSFLLIDKSPKK